MECTLHYFFQINCSCFRFHGNRRKFHWRKKMSFNEINPGIERNIKLKCGRRIRIIQTCAICGLRLKSFTSRAFGSMEFNKLHKITPSRRVKAKTRISESGQFALWSAGIALHPTNHSVHSRHKSSDTLVAILFIVLLLFYIRNLVFSEIVYTTLSRADTARKNSIANPYIDHFWNLYFCGSITIRTFHNEIKRRKIIIHELGHRQHTTAILLFFSPKFNSIWNCELCMNLVFEFDYYSTNDLCICKYLKSFVYYLLNIFLWMSQSLEHFVAFLTFVRMHWTLMIVNLIEISLSNLKTREWNNKNTL